MELNSKIYIAGHTGLLGSAVIRKLNSLGYRNLIFQSSKELDLLNQFETYEFLNHVRPEYVFMCAARVGGINANIRRPAEFLHDNLTIQNNVIEGSRRAGVVRLLFVGSSCIYPKQAENPISEDKLLTGLLEPTNEGYALAKISGIKLCQYYRRQYGCDFISAIPPNLFGINDNYGSETSHLMAALIRKINNAKIDGKKSITIWGTGKPRRNSC